jgi:hypothetical protein
MPHCVERRNVVETQHVASLDEENGYGDAIGSIPICIIDIPCGKVSHDDDTAI